MPLYRMSGKPRAVKLVATSVQAAATGSGTNDKLLFDVTQFNYLGATIVTATRITGLRVPEAGVYRIEGHMGLAANSQTLQVMIVINGSGTFADTTLGTFNIGTILANGAFEVAQASHANVELSANDLVELWYAQSTAGAQPSAAGYTHLYVEKLHR